jgi:hypothetical protein
MSGSRTAYNRVNQRTTHATMQVYGLVDRLFIALVVLAALGTVTLTAVVVLF